MGCLSSLYLPLSKHIAASDEHDDIQLTITLNVLHLAALDSDGNSS